jgi:FAD/FMN-containing dehydrogenase
MTVSENVAAAKAALSHLDVETKQTAINSASRDFFWYSPVLKARMDHLVADFVVRPRSETEIIEILKICYAYDVPVTTRGAGTGNYGQAMPMRGGCVMHLRHMDQVTHCEPGRVIVEPGCLLKDVDAHCIAACGNELRMFSSTWATATVGGFIAGGSGGVGSVTWGSLRELGNIIRLRVVTMEKEPRVLEFTGEELARVSHAYGTNGIITELELPLAPAYDWTHCFVTAKDWDRAMQCADALANENGILLKIASVYEAPTAKAYFQRVAPYVAEDDHLIGLMVAPQSMEGFLTWMGRNPDLSLIYRSDDHNWARDPGLVFEYGWNHTTLRALKVDPSITYLQVVKFTTEDRLDEIVKAHEKAGAMIFNPHRYSLEEGGRQHADPTQLSFKKEADPKGLLNPGKMITWDDPDWDYAKMYTYADMTKAPEDV